VTGPAPAWTPPRTAEHPPEELLRRLELHVARRIDGILQGGYAGLLPGPGTEPGDARPYRVGDDVRLMDWNVTARTAQPHVRMPIAERELETWAIADLSASMDFGTAWATKRDLAVAVVAAVGHLAARAGNRLGALLVHGDRPPGRIPARTGRPHLMTLLHRVAAAPREDGTGPGDLGRALREVGRVGRRRGLVVVVSDFLAGGEWGRPLSALGTRHDVICVEIVDPRELELPDVGYLTLVDPETGDLLEVQTARRRVRRRYAEAAAAQRAGVAATITAAGADHLVLRTDSDWLHDFVRFVERRRRGRPSAAQGRRRPGMPRA